ncbi:hypothetical protein LOZ53_004153 [Ophidiomyces ophidiicola]|nr:hypothetical protein LOZ53_004153 [Ophidiomyces ophidiicola]KAI1989467.1 hypothetical protein LOZ54_002877 [Ophidiomyces ophidiicola]KAI1990559.1 hypothetical protein LOZ51_004910 [Ophidiomyces ophidiicola]
MAKNLVDLRSLEIASKYDGHLMCPICHCPFVHPMQLNCDHIFCQHCLDVCVGLDTLDDVLCPTCRSPIDPAIKSAPRLISAMCDDILVKCPYNAYGCDEVVQRCHIQAHVDKYCDYMPIPCLDVTCKKMIRAKDAPSDNRCLHELHECEDCGEMVAELHLNRHLKKECPQAEIKCSGCGATFCRNKLQEHDEVCPTSPCRAASYGCNVRLSKSEITAHEEYCPIIVLGPYFEKQSTRIASMEATIRQLQQRNEVLEEGIAAIRSSLQINPPILPTSEGAPDPPEPVVEDAPPPSISEFQAEPDVLPEPDVRPEPAAPVGNTNPTTYLLSIHESLRDDVAQLSSALSDLDARTNMSIMNENIRLREDMAHISAGLNTVRMQVHMLINSRLHQGQQRAMTPRPAPPAGNGGTNEIDIPGPSTATGQDRVEPDSQPRPRRLSDSREGTKL